ncbi:hypothetical protein [Vibrio algicola]|uniref:Uncharacterized protein n=1 Tax=Vibrio algicola TaxID=2662262 RepID=A0A5Q0TIT5_9VIBR|nr:hypothetical protein [Vibrio algicola]
MQIDLQTLSQNPYITLGSFALALFGIVLAIIFYVRSKKDKTPCYDSSSNTIIEGLNQALDGLEVHYKGQAQERVCVTKLVLWNAGRDTIDKSDLVERDQLRVVTPDGIELLDIQIIDVSTESNLVTLGEVTQQEQGAVFSIDFDFLDHADYLVIQIIHNGSSSEEFSIAGKIKGVKEIVKSDGIRLSSSQSKILRLLPIVGEFDQLMQSPRFMKYFGSIAYGGFGCFAVWHLINGKTDWYVWVGAGFCIFASFLVYFGHRNLSPVKI